VLGIGVSHAPMVAARGHTYAPPIAAMSAYLDRIAAASYRPPEPQQRASVVLAALAPRMLELAAERAAGVHPYLTTPEHTSLAREFVGAGRLVVPEQGVLLEPDATEARRLARQHVSYYLGLDNYRKSLLHLGFGEKDLANDGSDDLIDRIVAWGDVDAVCERVRAHLDAGANEVCVQAIGPGPLNTLRKLAGSLREL
jgi:probable F420-dependent oxidoreductase